jgi:hypothetical protein
LTDRIILEAVPDPTDNQEIAYLSLSKNSAPSKKVHKPETKTKNPVAVAAVALLLSKLAHHLTCVRE